MPKLSEIAERCAKAPKNLRVEHDPYPHLRDDEGCVLARDYIAPDKLAFICQAVNEHARLLSLAAEALAPFASAHERTNNTVHTWGDSMQLNQHTGLIYADLRQAATVHKLLKGE